MSVAPMAPYSNAQAAVESRRLQDNVYWLGTASKIKRNRPPKRSHQATPLPSFSVRQRLLVIRVILKEIPSFLAGMFTLVVDLKTAATYICISGASFVVPGTYVY